MTEQLPGRAAVIVVDVQNDFIHPEGKGGGPDGQRNLGHRVMTEERLAPFVEEARRQGCLIVWIRMENSAESITPANGRTKARMYGLETWTVDDLMERAVCVKDTWGADLYLEPEADDLVVPKPRYSSFVRTTLDEDLRARGVQTVLVTGVVTNACVESTARDAYQLDYDVVLVSDCVSEVTEEARAATFANIGRSFGLVLTAGETLARLPVMAEVPRQA